MLKKISEYRSQLMGIAIIMVVIYHSNFQINIPILASCKRTLYSGVDIFMFVSGLGIYYSLANRRKGFFVRRIKKVLPAYLPVLFVWTLFNCKKVISLEFAEIFMTNLLGISFWLNRQPSFNWYIQAIWLFYILSIPFFYLIKRNSKKINIIIVIFSIAIGIFFVNNYTLIAVSRLTIFIMGMICGGAISKKVELKGIEEAIIYLGAAIALGFLFFSFSNLEEYLRNYGIYWYPFIFVTPGTVLLLCRAFTKLQKLKTGRMMLHLLSLLGEVSIEIYLIHLVVYEYILHDTYSNALWFVVIIIMLALGEIYGKALKSVSRLIK